MAGIRGLDIFGQHFSAFREHYVLIGGVASWLSMDDAGLPFRATRDLDIVLVIEALNAEFVEHFWNFIKAGEYRMDDSVSSLSAILLDDPYYAFLLDGRQSNEVVTFIGADRLIPLKAYAWLNLRTRKHAGEKIDSKNIRKHRNDVLQLSAQLTENVIQLPEHIQSDMAAFLQLLEKEEFDPASIGLKGSLDNYIVHLRSVFAL